MLVDIFPRLATDDHRDKRLADTELCSDVAMKHLAVKLANLAHRVRIKFDVRCKTIVLCLRQWREMVGVHTFLIFTFVMDVMSIRDRSTVPLIHPAVRQLLSILHADNAVSALADSKQPVPAAGFRIDGELIELAAGVTGNESHRLAANLSALTAAALRKWCALTASAHAEAARVGFGDVKLRGCHGVTPNQSFGGAAPRGSTSPAGASLSLNYTGFTGRMA